MCSKMVTFGIMQASETHQPEAETLLLLSHRDTEMIRLKLYIKVNTWPQHSVNNENLLFLRL